MISRLWREPLLHFLLIGAALFVLYDLTRTTVSEAPKRILVTPGQVEQLEANFERTWSRPPTPEELGAMVEGHVREEVFYREALAMGLDQDDPQVRRRMRMKLEFILEDLSAQDYGDEVLKAYLQLHADRFRNETQLSLRQVYLNPDRREDLAADIKKLLTSLNQGVNPDTLGDPTLAPRAYLLARQSEIARDFGDEFAREVAALPPGGWTGPLYSPFGAHLVMIDRRIDARLPALTEIRDRVFREYQAEQRKQQKDVAYQKLRETYEITIEHPGNAAGGTVSSAAAGETR